MKRDAGRKMRGLCERYAGRTMRGLCERGCRKEDDGIV